MSKHRLNPETLSPYAEELAESYLASGIDIMKYPELSLEDYEKFFGNPQPPQNVRISEGTYEIIEVEGKLEWGFVPFTEEEIADELVALSLSPAALKAENDELKMRLAMIEERLGLEL